MSATDLDIVAALVGAVARVLYSAVAERTTGEMTLILVAVFLKTLLDRR
jgi:hypothetical protein